MVPGLPGTALYVTVLEVLVPVLSSAGSAVTQHFLSLWGKKSTP